MNPREGGLGPGAADTVEGQRQYGCIYTGRETEEGDDATEGPTVATTPLPTRLNSPRSAADRTTDTEEGEKGTRRKTTGQYQAKSHHRHGLHALLNSLKRKGQPQPGSIDTGGHMHVPPI